ncbi:NAD(P)-dependent oxidoreductase [Phosphitispora fastidiosa]|uniref:NAD(P)-dependent oxidoreductase n=1 Tax=Phosphitispora fastidiosa TaxID=2837202 RepID=UPI001E43AC63|nr:NAD(P)-dependent oxidoreductase [Phosphitispora fastidiosa]MBU7008841.1 lactate dehydrogenase-like 2-hydroxyacid dehydrogenase [Phosphitispora fastidiosa]
MRQHSSNNTPQVYYNHLVPVEGPDLLKPFFNVIVPTDIHSLTPARIALEAQEAFGLCVSVEHRISGELIAQLPYLRVISSFGRGLDNIDVEEATKHGIWVTCVYGEEIDDSVADMTWALLLGLARKVAVGDRTIRVSGCSSWSPHPRLGSKVSHKRLGIIGMGKLGQAVARRAMGFGMEVCYYQPLRLPIETESTLRLEFAERHTLFQQADFICICSTLTQDTYHQIGVHELSLMKPTSLLINPSRGSQVDECAVAQALKDGIIGGYAADVFEMEDAYYAKPGVQIPRGLLDQKDKTLFSPHAGTAVVESRVYMARVQAQAVLDVWQGQRPQGAVNNALELT